MKYDWAAIRAYYDQGHSVQECKAKFGFGNGAWDAAVGRGDVVPRTAKQPRFRHHTRDAVQELLESGLTQTEVAFELGLSKGTVCYHARQLGMEGIPASETAMTGRKFSGHTTPECRCASASSNLDSRRRPGTTPGGEGCSERGLRAHRLRSCSSRVAHAAAGHLRARLLKAGLKEERCEECGLEEWRGQPLRVTLHHINGDPYDNRLDNLVFLCPNCHSQTPNFGGRNGHVRPRDD